MGKALAQGVYASFDDVSGRVHVGLADFEMNDVLALTLQGAGAHQNFEGGLGSQARHPLGQAQFELSSSHRQTDDYTLPETSSNSNSQATPPFLFGSRVIAFAATRTARRTGYPGWPDQDQHDAMVEKWRGGDPVLREGGQLPRADRK